MAQTPVAPEGPALDSSQQSTAPSAIPDQIPSAIDTAAEMVGLPTEPLPETETVGAPAPEVAAETQLNNQSGETSMADMQSQLQGAQDDVNTLSMIRNDPVAAKWLNDHYAAKARGELPVATGDAPAEVPNGQGDPRFDQLFASIQSLTTEFQQDRAERSIREFAAANPVVKTPAVAKAVQRVVGQNPGLSLNDALAVALSGLGMSAQAGGPAPLQPSEVSGAPRTGVETTDDTIQSRIDGQKSFEAGLDVALRETAKEQGFSF